MSPPLLHVRAGDVDLDGIHRGIVEAPCELLVLADGGARDVGEEAGLAEAEPRKDPVDDRAAPRVLEANRVEHPARGLVHAVRSVAEPGLQGRALEADGAGVAILEAFYPGVILAEPHAPGEEDDGGGEGDAAQLDGERRGGFLELSRGGGGA